MIVLSALVTPANRHGEDKVGDSVNIFCERCGCFQSEMMGVGFFTFLLFLEIDLETEKPHYHGALEGNEKVIAEVDRIVETEENVRVSEELEKTYGWNLYYCRKCKTVKRNLSFRLVFTGGSYEPTYFCEKCKSELLEAFCTDYSDSSPYDLRSVASGEHLDLKCPLCGLDKVSLTFGSILWD